MSLSAQSRLALLMGNTPFPWQIELLNRFLEGACPRRLDIPTGLGKTSVIAVWLAARSVAAGKLPRRLIYVVNRRTIVDQASDTARQLQQHEGAANLAVSTLRGQLQDNEQWLMDPSRPAIVIGTVDMIGSRLLFNGYRQARTRRAADGGLLASDALVIHDEAHLTPVFDRLLDRIVVLQSDRMPLRLRVMSLSATGRGDGEGEVPFALTAADHEHPVVLKRIGASKRLRIHDPQKDLARQLAGLAAAHTVPARVMVFVRSPEMARKVGEVLCKFHKVPEDRIDLLTGTIRGFERDKLGGKPVYKHFLERTQPVESVFLICTSAGEVGVDFDADHLVADLSTIDSTIQRLGRVNRRGEGDAAVDMVADVGDVKSSLYGPKSKTLEVLLTLPTLGDGSLDACPRSLRALTGHPEYARALTPPPVYVELDRITIDAWSLTSIHDPWPVAKPVGPFLHGLSPETDDTEIAWRAEVAYFDPAAIDAGALEDWLERHPIKPFEMLRDRTDRVVAWLAAVAEKAPGTRVILSGRTTRWCVLDGSVDWVRFGREIADHTVVVDPATGGLDPSGMLNDAAIGLPATDVADTGGDRERYRLTGDGETFRLYRFPGEPGEPADGTSRAQLIRSFAQVNRLKLHHSVTTRTDASEGTSLEEMLFFRRVAPRGAAPAGGPPSVKAHNRDVHARAAVFADRLQVSRTIAAGLRFAADHHDDGKRRGLWQSAIFNADPVVTLAKSGPRGMDGRRLNGYRHEFGSLCDALRSEAFQTLDEQAKDLALHLIAIHHGRGRPHFPKGDFDPDVPGAPPPELRPAEIARRFARLQRMFGHWGLAWIESLLIAADAAASSDAQEDA